MPGHRSLYFLTSPHLLHASWSEEKFHAVFWSPVPRALSLSEKLDLTPVSWPHSGVHSKGPRMAPSPRRPGVANRGGPLCGIGEWRGPAFNLSGKSHCAVQSALHGSRVVPAFVHFFFSEIVTWASSFAEFAHLVASLGRSGALRWGCPTRGLLRVKTCTLKALS